MFGAGTGVVKTISISLGSEFLARIIKDGGNIATSVRTVKKIRVVFENLACNRYYLSLLGE